MIIAILHPILRIYLACKTTLLQLNFHSISPLVIWSWSIRYQWILSPHFPIIYLLSSERFTIIVKFISFLGRCITIVSNSFLRYDWPSHCHFYNWIFPFISQPWASIWCKSIGGTYEEDPIYCKMALAFIILIISYHLPFYA